MLSRILRAFRPCRSARPPSHENVQGAAAVEIIERSNVMSNESEEVGSLLADITAILGGDPIATKGDPIAAIERRVIEASNIRSTSQASRFAEEAAAAVTAMTAQAKHARAVVACVDDHIKAVTAMNQLLDAVAEMQVKMQVRRDLESENYESETADERERFVEATHKLLLADKRRGKEQLQADRERLNAKHGLQAERVFKRERFALGQIRIEGKIAEAQVDVAVARNAAGESPAADVPEHKATDAAALYQLVERKQKEIAEADADGEDTAEQHQKLALLTKLLGELALDGKKPDAKTD